MAETIKGISSMATRKLLAELSGLHEQRSGCKVVIQAMGGIDAAKIVRNGDDCDIVILASSVMEQLEIEGHVRKGSRHDIARSAIAIAVRAGADRPAIDTEDAVRQAMIAAGRIGFSTGPSGDHLKQLWSRWRIGDRMAQRSIQAPAGVPVAHLLAQGDIDLGVQQMSEMLDCPGVQIVGPLPPEIQATTIFTAGIARLSPKIDLASGLIVYMTSPETTGLKRRHGMDAAV